MTIFLDKYTDNAEKMRETMHCMGRDVNIVVLEDNGFLPDGVLSPYDFFLYRNHEGELVERDLFYNFIELPEFWEVRLMGWMGGIFDMGHEKARVYFREPVRNRSVERVEWHTENGQVYKIDHYNKYGLKYVTAFLDADGNVESKGYYSEKNQEVIVEQPVNHIISMLENGALKKCFVSYAQFIDYYMKEAALEEDSVLIVQEEETFETMGLSSGNRDLWKRILFSDSSLLNKYIDGGGKNGYRFYALQEKYPDNKLKGDAMILTASDRIEKIECLINELPDVVFHIAANTQVSDKINKLAEFENVRVYPQISGQDLKRLWDICDFYLDINHYREIYDAVNVAHEKNLMIMGFENTVHHRELVANACIFDAGDYEKMVLAIKNLRNGSVERQELLAVQQQKKQEIWEKILKMREDDHDI